jgi:hypothetical protein
MSFQLLRVALNRTSDRNVLFMIHTYVVFLWYLTSISNAMKYIEMNVPWIGLVALLNSLIKTPSIDFAKVVASVILSSDSGAKWRPLCKDFLLQSQLYFRGYNFNAWFKVTAINNKKQTLKLLCMHVSCMKHILWVCHKIAVHSRWFMFDLMLKQFVVLKS